MDVALFSLLNCNILRILGKRMLSEMTELQERDKQNTKPVHY